jgi:Transcription elongation factor, GreA/GreB, C-term
MATDRRVLVTAKTAEAISVVQEKLPQSLGRLTIAVVHSDREGAKQLEDAISAMSHDARAVDRNDITPIGSAAINEVYTKHRVIRAGGKPMIVADPECVAHAVVGEGEAVEGADGRLATSVQPSATPAPKPEVRPAAEPVVSIPTIPLPSPLPAAASSEPAPLAPSAAPGQQVLPRVGAENLSAESLPVDETGFHLEETQPEIVGPDTAIVLFYPETRNRRTIRISSQEDAPDSNVIHVDRPLARALIGATIDETVELEVSGKTIRMIVEQIYPHLEAAE